MTSGQEETAYNGAGRIAERSGRAAGRIEVLPAGGINRFNVADVIARTGCTRFTGCEPAHRPPRRAAGRRLRLGAAIKPAEDRFDAVHADAVADMSVARGARGTLITRPTQVKTQRKTKKSISLSSLLCAFA